jgi:TRAP-type C4-dicarboxylate transport system permease large subunit
VFYLLLGAVFDEFAAMLITLPFILPVIVGFGYDPVWWGIINVIIIELGLIIPPIGFIIFLLHGQHPSISLNTMYRGVTPFIMADLVVLVLLTLFPGLALWLPAVLGR